MLDPDCKSTQEGEDGRLTCVRKTVAPKLIPVPTKLTGAVKILIVSIKILAESIKVFLTLKSNI